jgi:hypothetical protein
VGLPLLGGGAPVLGGLTVSGPERLDPRTEEFHRPAGPLPKWQGGVLDPQRAHVADVAEQAASRCDEARSVTEGDRPAATPLASPARTLTCNRWASRPAKAGSALSGVTRGDKGRVQGSARAGNRLGERCHHRRQGQVKRPAPRRLAHSTIMIANRNGIRPGM